MKTQLGQLLLIGVPKAAWSPGLERLLQRFAPSGLLLQKLGSAGATAELSKSVSQAVGQAPFLAIEDDGDGSLGQLFASIPPLTRLDSDSAELAGDLIGRAMALLGLNLNLAPVVDLPAGARDRSKVGAGGPDSLICPPAEVASRAEAFVRGLTRHRVLACAGHFPGMRATAADEPPNAPVVDRAMAVLWREDLMPYRMLVEKLPMVQITHAVHKAYDYEFPLPASLSPSVIEGLLRLKLGYQGVALADASAAARAAGIEIAEAAVRALAAGCDLAVVPGEEKLLQATLDALERAIEFGSLTRERVEQALERVKHIKKGIARPGKEPSQRELARLQRDFDEFARRRADQRQEIA